MVSWVNEQRMTRGRRSLSTVETAMKMLLRRCVLLGTLLWGAPAWAGGAGVVLETMYYPRYGSPSAGHAAPGFLVCLGGVGMGYGRSGLRLGGEGLYCQGRRGVKRTMT